MKNSRMLSKAKNELLGDILIVIVALLIIAITSYFLSKTKEAQGLHHLYKMTIGMDNLSDLDPEVVRNIKYPKVLTKNGLRPEIENELYTGDRNKECRKDSRNRCIPEKDSEMGVLFSTVKKEDRDLAEKFLLMSEAADQEFLKDTSQEETEEIFRKEEIANACYYLLSDDVVKVIDASILRRKMSKFEHIEEYIVSYSTGAKFIRMDYNGISSEVNKQYVTKEKCVEYLRENSN